MPNTRKTRYVWYLSIVVWAGLLVGLFLMRNDPVGVVAMQAAPDLTTRSGAQSAAPASVSSGSSQLSPRNIPLQGTPTPTPTACPTNNYTVTVATGNIVTGTVDIGNHVDDGDTLITLPFSYRLYSRTFNTVNVSSNGRLDFVTANEPGGYVTSCLPAPPNQGTYDFTIFPYWTDLTTANSGFGVFTSISGSAPNRIFNIEWRAQYFSGGTLANFEVRLFEGQQRFDVIYGTLGTTANYTIGIQGPAPNGQFTQYTCNSGQPAPGTRLTFALPPCTVGTPTPAPTCSIDWNVVNSPNNPNGVNGNALVDVAAVSANDVWAAGTSVDQSFAKTGPSPLIEHWNGNAWYFVPSPSINGAFIGGVGTLPNASNDVWVVGDYDSGAPVVHQPLLMHWNGTAWSTTSPPAVSVPPGGIHDVGMVASNDVWAVGSYIATGGTPQSLALHWTGAAGWTQVPVPIVQTSSSLQGLAIVSANDIWAVGEVNGNTPLFMHWNGNAWSRFNNPAAVSGVLYRASAVSASDIWAVGYLTDGSGLSLTMHYNGTSWAVVNNPLPCCNHELTDVAAIASNDVWAVSENAFIHWDGTTWNYVSGAGEPPAVDYSLQGLGKVSATDVWAVGHTHTEIGGSFDGTLTEHFSSSCLQPTATFVATNTPTVTGTPVAAATNYVVIPATGTVVPGTTDIGNHCGDCVTTISLPFPATLYDQRFNSVTLGSNGTLGFVANGNPPTNGCVPNVAGDFAIWAYWDDLATDCTGCGIFTSTSNTAPNRIFNIEWRGMRVGGSNVQFEVRLYEGQGRFDLVYGHVDPGSTESVGVQRDSGSLFTRVVCQLSGSPEQSSKTDPDGWIIEQDGMLIFTGPPSCPIEYPDVPPNSTFYPYVHCLACLGIINGFPDGSFRPNNQVTRGQLSKIVANSAGFAEAQATQMFQDVPLGHTFQVYVGRLASRGFINGYSCGGPGEPCIAPDNLPYFRPNNNATRGQISKIVSNSAGFAEVHSTQSFQDVPIGSTFYDFVERLASRGVMSGYACGGTGEPCIGPGNLPYFRPNNNATRGQTSKIVSNTFFPDCAMPLGGRDK